MTHPKVKCSISPTARLVLSRLKQRDLARFGEESPEFRSSAIESSHPYVDESILDRIYALDRGFQVYWELQGSGEFRWHVMKHKAESRADDPWSIYLVEDQESNYLPVDLRVLRKMERVCWLNRDIRRYVRSFQEEENRIADIKDADARREQEAAANELRTLFKRMAFAQGSVSVDPGWGVGISKRSDGTYETGTGSKSRKVTKAV